MSLARCPLLIVLAVLSGSACAEQAQTGVEPATVQIAVEPRSEGGASPRRRARAKVLAGGRVRVAGLDRYEVEASLYEELVERGRGLEGVKTSVVERDGKAVGLLLSGVRRGSVLEALGLRDDDVIESINGFPVGLAEGRRLAYASVRSGVRVSVVVSREGEQRLLEYELVYF